jgi:cysteine synthase A
MIAHSITDLIGHTPLIEIPHLDAPATILAKAEYLNPGGSIKDRIAAHLIDQATRRGEITPETTLIEPTSGNTGIGLAMVCAARNIPLILTLPESMSLERRTLLSHLGARIVLTPAEKGMQGSVDEAKHLERTTPGGLILGQFTHPDNPDTHVRTTAEEILADAPHVDLFVVAVGTGGSLTGIGHRLRRANPSLRIVAVEPDTSAVLSGQAAGAHAIQGIGAGFIPEILDTDLIDEILTVTDEEAIAYARDAARHAGLLIGISSGANLAAAHRLARAPENSGKIILTLLPDGAERYLSTNLFHSDD